MQTESPAEQAMEHSEEEDDNDEQQQEPKDFAKMLGDVSTAIPERGAVPPSICEVPEDLAEGNKAAYIPKVVCIGPLFDSLRGTASMLRLERYKWRCLRTLIVGRGPAAAGPTTTTLDDPAAGWSAEVHAPVLRRCFNRMVRLVPRIRASYGTVSSSSGGGGGGMNGDDEKLALHMLLDGCFILHRLLKYARPENGGGDRDDWSLLFGRCWVWGTVKRDLLLLSNQVPFVVVRKLFKLLVGEGSGGEDVLVAGGLNFLSSLHPRPLHSAPIDCRGVHHLLHLLYLSIDLPPSQQPRRQHQHLPPSELTRWVPCAKELEEAGVKLKPRATNKAKSFLDVGFRGGVLEIPPLRLFDYSEPLFRNLIAFEQTYPATASRVTAYAIFMGCLVKTPDDVRILHRRGVLENHMNGAGRDDDSALVGFFAGLCAEAHTSADRDHLATVMVEVVRYQSGRWPQWRAALKRDYFSNPWAIAAVVAAATGLALTVLQTFYSVYTYYKPPQ
ncbi:unnamed protein product [Urochloa decumbens]|uniref:Uncharacterized protein n=1 Tax=Urochloa decumbens TaxID=240449 RepID=A0ABC9GDA7_9POAL